MFDSYDPARVPPLPLPIPATSRPRRVVTTPPVSELVVEMVTAGQGVAVLPAWVVEPYRETRRVAAVRITASPEVRTWSCATRDDHLDHVAVFVDVLRDHFAGGRGPGSAARTAA